jgi:hypothetical protein
MASSFLRPNFPPGGLIFHQISPILAPRRESQNCLAFQAVEQKPLDIGIAGE